MPAPATPRPAEQRDALVAALIDLEHHVGEAGWDQPPRLFALVLTDLLVASEPELARTLGLRGTADGGADEALTAVEQEEFTAGEDVLTALVQIEWPEAVFGCAISLVRTFLPTAYEGDLPDDPQQAASAVAAHPQRQEIRVVVGTDRAGHRHGVARLVSAPHELLAADDLVPGLAEALAHTLV
jgi:hypothetical protein